MERKRKYKASVSSLKSFVDELKEQRKVKKTLDWWCYNETGDKPAGQEK